MGADRWWKQEPGEPVPDRRPAVESGNGAGVVALVVAILGVLVPQPVGIVLCAIALAVAGLALSRAEEGKATGKGLGTAALVVGLVGIGLPLLLETY